MTILKKEKTVVPNFVFNHTFFEKPRYPFENPHSGQNTSNI